MSIVEVFMQPFRLWKILIFFDASETKTNVVIIPFSFLRYDESQ